MLSVGGLKLKTQPDWALTKFSQDYVFYCISTTSNNNVSPKKYGGSKITLSLLDYSIYT